MADLIIKPLAGAGNTVRIQDQAGGSILTSANSGATITNATLTGLDTGTQTLTNKTLTSPTFNNDRGTKANQNYSLGTDVIQAGLILYYNAADSNCYGTSGTAVNDLSSGNNDGVMGSAVAYSASWGGVWDFTGGGDTTGYIGTSLTYPTTDEITFMKWIYYDTNTDSTHQLSGIQAGSGYCYVGRDPASTRHVYAYVGAGTNWADVNSVMTGGKWHHLAVGHSNGNGTVGMGFAYLDGHLIAMKQTANVTAHSNVFNIGGVNGNAGATTNANYTLNGKIASCQVYNRPLCHPEIIHNMNVDLPRLLH
jgi:hypothetical protein